MAMFLQRNYAIISRLKKFGYQNSDPDSNNYITGDAV
jgi:hypothetical protein